MLPFTENQFFDLFARYNTEIWPAQVAAYGFGVIALVATQRRTRIVSMLSFLSLALLWGWTGLVYHGGYFTQINPAAWLFAALFIGQSVLLAVFAFRTTPNTTGRFNGSRAAGWAMILYSLAVYPILSAALGHGYPNAPTFGVTPCPLVIFTFGLLTLSSARAPWILFVAPTIWAVIGGAAAFVLGVAADLALPAAALAAILANALKRQSDLADAKVA